MFLEIKERVRELLEGALEEPIALDDITDSSIADLSSTIAFKIAKEQRKDPEIIADGLVKRMRPRGFIKEIRAERGYINFFLDYSKLIVPALKEIRLKKGDYGKLKTRNRKIILEHTSINPSGPVHIGRLRNSLIGDSLSRILRFNGYDVETHYYVNDVGKQIAIIAQGFKDGIEQDESIIKDYEEYKDKGDFEVFFEYVAANKRFESDPDFAERVQRLIWSAENGDERALNEMANVAKRCLEGQMEIFEKLGIEFDFFDLESEYIKKGKVRSVLNFLKKSRYAEVDESGLGLNLKDFGLERRTGRSILARSDGTSVYLARDVAYHLEKSKLGDRMINVLGEDHKFEFLELKTILTEIYKLKIPLDAVHYSFVNFEGGELSTRRGLIAPVDRLIDEAVEKAEEEIRKRKIASRDMAPLIGIGAIKYHILKTTPSKPITFRWEDALSFDGDSAPYIQYAHARCCSILRKSKTKIEIEEIDRNLEDDEKRLLLKILKFREIVDKSGRELKPNIVANYLYELSSLFSKFYKECPVLYAERAIRDRRLLLVDASRQVIRNGLFLLGIEAPERM
ncbi:MAG TPA: arginine--tRNA ligase [Candidatus Altiarchaeales archaeon]|nr:arginine--tRNA ligase [Candidatus Altiarchaeales archaeon]